MPIDHACGAREMAQADHDVEKLALDEQVFGRRNKTIIFD